MPEHADPELLKKLERAMPKLPRSTREIFLAHRLDDMSYRGISDRTGLTVGEVERHMAKAIYLLSRELDDEPFRCRERLLRWPKRLIRRSKRLLGWRERLLRR